MSSELLSSKTREVALADIEVSEQVRTEFDDAFIDGLAVSIKQHGQLQPVLVRQVGDKYALIAGEQRVQALQRNGATTVRVTVVEGQPDESDILILQLTENMQRADLCPLDIANGIQALIATKGWKAAQVAGQLGISPTMVTKYQGLLKLSESVQAKVASGEIPLTAAYQLSRVATDEERDQLVDDLTSGKLNRDSLTRAIKVKARESKEPKEPKAPSTSRATASLPGGRTVTVTGTDLDLETFIEALEDVLGKARKERVKGTSLSTFTALLRDQSIQATLTMEA